MSSTKLFNVTKNSLVVDHVESAKSFSQRFWGLIGKRNFLNSAMWFPACKSVHTCFMKMDIDIVFVDPELRVTGIFRHTPPWKFVWSLRKTFGVFELAAGQSKNIEIGDTLNVVTNTDR